MKKFCFEEEVSSNTVVCLSILSESSDFDQEANSVNDLLNESGLGIFLRQERSFERSRSLLPGSSNREAIRHSGVIY